MRPAYSRGAGDACPIKGAAIHPIPSRRDRSHDVIQGSNGCDRIGNVSTCGRATAIPPVRGSNDSAAFLGFTPDDVVGESAQLRHRIAEEFRSIAFLPAVAGR